MELKKDLKEIEKTEWSSKFEHECMLRCPDDLKNAEYHKGRKDRMIMSYFKYGPAGITYGDKLSNALDNLDRCLAKYKDTKNTEYLMDAGNYFMLEFMFPTIGWSIPKDKVYYKQLRHGYAPIELITECVKRYKENNHSVYLYLGCIACVEEYTNPSIEGAFFKATASEETAGIVGYCANDCCLY